MAAVCLLCIGNSCSALCHGQRETEPLIRQREYMAYSVEHWLACRSAAALKLAFGCASCSALCLRLWGLAVLYYILNALLRGSGFWRFSSIFSQCAGLFPHCLCRNGEFHGAVQRFHKEWSEASRALAQKICDNTYVCRGNCAACAAARAGLI